MYKSVIIGIKGEELLPAEIELIKKNKPLGFILFSRNTKSIENLTTLIKQLRLNNNNKNIPILVDQEGGNVVRLSPPNWPLIPTMASFGTLANKDLNLSIKLLRITIRSIAGMLREVGINVVTSPVLDLYYKGANKVIGSRAFSDKLNIVLKLGQVVVDEYNNCGIMPIVKHLPGHGRVLVDSHIKLPKVNTSLNKLMNTDFLPFKKIKTIAPMMSAHVCYYSLDSKNPFTTSSKAIKIIKSKLKIKNKIISDCITMSALSGDLIKRTKSVINAGIDITLCSKASIDEYQQILSISKNISVDEFRNFKFPEPIYNSKDINNNSIEYYKDLLEVINILSKLKIDYNGKQVDVTTEANN